VCNNFARTCHAPNAKKIGMLGQRHHRVLDETLDTARGRRIVFGDEPDDRRKIAACGSSRSALQNPLGLARSYYLLG
jgi:hypothetical protein